MIKRLLPTGIKDVVKDKIKSSLRLVPQRTLDMANRVAVGGVNRYLAFEYETFKKQTLAYVEEMCTGNYSYRFANSVKQDVLYASIYACMIKGMFGELDNLSKEDKKRWTKYLDSFQSEDDGYFRDPNLAGNEFENDGAWGDGWGKNHLVGHAIIAYARLGSRPKYDFKFLEPYYDHGYLRQWLSDFDFSQNVWSQSNYIMNVVTTLQYSRDHMGDLNAQEAINTCLNWLRSSQCEDTGMWHDYDITSYKTTSDAIRGAYHFYPLFFYEHEVLPFGEKIIDIILSSQNSWGGFENEFMPAGACEDIDALDPLLRFSQHTNYRESEVKFAVKKSMIWYLASLNKTGGFEFMLETPNEYGKHPLTSSKINEANMFGTWFRTLGLAYILDYLKIPNDFDIGHYPGYEIKL
ncbi:MAG: hypothetical protein WA775_13605 [Psychroserpens sp.]|uniref:hypothetical protein n=1 Tax=Psychroserpens sp. TaxID=2020870 RepID=UPI003CA111F0